MKIGIGCISYQRPKHLDFWRKQVIKYAPHYFEISIYLDEPDRKGIAHGKNQNLKDLKDCDYVFLFDDDCFPIKAGWAEWFIRASEVSGQKHFMYLKETPSIKKTGTKTADEYEEKLDINIYDNCAGCMMFLTKEVIEKVGGYRIYPSPYGFEHAGYSNRIHAAGLTPLGKYTCPSGAGEYIYSLDLDNHLPINKQLKHEPSMAKEIQKVPGYIAENRKIYEQDTQIYIPL